MSKFNVKVYQDKPRVYRPVVGAPRISRLYIWSKEHREYRPPVNGGGFMARRYEISDSGKTVRKEKFFEKLEVARSWQQAALGDPVERKASPRAAMAHVDNSNSPYFSDLISEWKQRKFSSMALSTRVSYEKIIRLYMGGLFKLLVNEIDAREVDDWIDRLKTVSGPNSKPKLRTSFKHELSLLSTILKYYEEYYDDPLFRFPIKRRHRKAIRVKNRVSSSPKDLTEEEFRSFREKLRELPHGPILSAMATVQYHQALRVSEVAAIRWSDMIVDRDEPHKSRLKITHSVCWPRKKGLKSFVQPGFKNAASNEGTKEQPLFPEAYEAISNLKAGSGLLFHSEGTHFEYRQIQHAYDTAFEAAGLPYRGTHVMRHGGCRRIYNEVGDTAVAQQLLGNSSLQTTLIYAKRHKGALTKVSDSHWEKSRHKG